MVRSTRFLFYIDFSPFIAFLHKNIWSIFQSRLEYWFFSLYVFISIRVWFLNRWTIGNVFWSNKAKQAYIYSWNRKVYPIFNQGKISVKISSNEENTFVMYKGPMSYVEYFGCNTFCVALNHNVILKYFRF